MRLLVDLLARYDVDTVESLERSARFYGVDVEPQQERDARRRALTPASVGWSDCR